MKGCWIIKIALQYTDDYADVYNLVWNTSLWIILN
jgi:hypothetical protein